MRRSRPGEMPGGLLPTGAAVLYIRLHVSELGVQTGAWSKPAAAHGADERARALERQCGDVAAEGAPDPILVEILLDVRQIKRGNRRALGADVVAHGADRLWTREVAHDGHQQVLRLERLHELVVFVVRQEA